MLKSVHRNQLVENDLFEFKSNFHLVTQGRPIRSLKAQNNITGPSYSLSSLNNSFVKVTNKKQRIKRNREDSCKLPNVQYDVQNRRVGYALRSREYHKSDNNIIVADVDKEILSVHDEGRKFGNIQESVTKCFSTLKNEEFPALPGVDESHRPVMLSDWTKAVTKSNDKESPNCGAPSNNDAVVEIENILERENWADKELAPLSLIHI